MRCIVFLILIFGLNCKTLLATDGYTVNSYKVKISGTSSIHDWVVYCNQVSGLGAFVIEPNNKLKEIKSMVLDIKGKGLKSEKKSKTMDKKMYEALNVFAYPNITFTFNKVVSYPTSQNGNVLTALGIMNIAGVTKEENLNVKTMVNEDGTIVFSGEKKITMSDYKIKPPVAMLGALTVGQDVIITFELVMKKK